MVDIGGLIRYIREEPSLHLSDIQRQAIVNRLSFDLTEGEMRLARQKLGTKIDQSRVSS